MSLSVLRRDSELKVFRRLKQQGYSRQEIETLFRENKKIKSNFYRYLTESESKAASYLRYCLEKEEKGEQETFLHQYKLSYRAPFEKGSIKDKALHRQLVSFLSSIAGILDVSLMPLKSDKGDASSSVKDVIFATEYYVPVKSVVIDDQVYLKNEVVQVTEVNESQNYVELNHKHKIDYVTFFETFQPFKRSK